MKNTPGKSTYLGRYAKGKKLRRRAGTSRSENVISREQSSLRVESSHVHAYDIPRYLAGGANITGTEHSTNSLGLSFLHVKGWLGKNNNREVAAEVFVSCPDFGSASHQARIGDSTSLFTSNRPHPSLFFSSSPWLAIICILKSIILLPFLSGQTESISDNLRVRPCPALTRTNPVRYSVSGRPPLLEHKTTSACPRQCSYNHCSAPRSLDTSVGPG